VRSNAITTQQTQTTGFEPTIEIIRLLQTYALGRMATEIGSPNNRVMNKERCVGLVVKLEGKV